MRMRLRTIRISRNFDIDDLRSGHFCDPPMLSMGKFSNPSNLRENGPVYLEICCHRQWTLILVQLVTSDLWNAFWGHDDVIRGHGCFLSITHDWVKIETWKWCQCVCLVKTDQMMCNMTYLTLTVALTWGQILNWPWRSSYISFKPVSRG